MPNIPYRPRRGAPPWLWLLLALILGGLTWGLVVVANNHRRAQLGNDQAERQIAAAGRQVSHLSRLMEDMDWPSYVGWWKCMVALPAHLARDWVTERSGGCVFH